VLCDLAWFGRVFWNAWLGKGQGQDRWSSIQSSFMALGEDTHKLPVRADVREAIGKEVGDTVAVLLEERMDS